MPLAQDLDSARALARDGFRDARDYLGAKSFRILDEAGRVLAQEPFSLRGARAKVSA